MRFKIFRALPPFISTAGVMMIAIVVAFVSCAGPAAAGRSALKIELVPRAVALTLTPDIDLQIVSYHVSGEGPDGESFGFDTEQTNCVADDLVHGLWIVEVSGDNINGETIGRGSTEVVLDGSQQSATVELRFEEGSGTVDLTVTASRTLSPDWELTATATGEGMNSVSLEIERIGDRSFRAYAALAAGCYQIEIYVDAAGAFLAGATAAGYVLADETTYGAMELPLPPAPSFQFSVHVPLPT